MDSLPDDILDEVFTLAVALGSISANVASRICFRWNSKFQRVLFRSITLDPFETNTILDLDTPEYSHLAYYVEEVRVMYRPGTQVDQDQDQDFSPSFTNFLRAIRMPCTMIFCDGRIQWENVSPESIASFLDVFQRDSFRSLEISVNQPLPYWMLLRGLGNAPKLTVHCVGQIMPPLPSMVLNPCSLTHLVLFGNASVRQMAEFCSQPRGSAAVLLRKVNRLEIEYVETHEFFAPVMAPFVENLIVFVGAQLEVFDIHIQSFKAFEDAPTPHISKTVLQHLQSLQHIHIHFTGFSTGNNVLMSAKDYIQSFIDGLPSLSPVASLSLRIDEQTGQVNPEADGFLAVHENLLYSISDQLASTNKWPSLNSVSTLVDMQDDFSEPTRATNSIITGRLKIMSLLQINYPDARHFKRPAGALISMM